jgi:hypothetical protein
MQMRGSPKAVRKIKVHAVPACEHDSVSSGANLTFDTRKNGRATDAFPRLGIAINEEGWATLRNDDLQSSSSGHP